MDDTNSAPGFHRILLDGLLDAVVVIRPDGRVEYANPSVTRVLGYQPDELLGNDVGNLLPEMHPSPPHDLLDRYAQVGAAALAGRSRTIPVRHRDGTLHLLNVSVSAISHGGRLRFAAVLRPVTPSEPMPTPDATPPLGGTDPRWGGRPNVQLIGALLRVDPQGLLVVANVDGIRRINAAYGRPTGDRVLEAVARALRSTLGPDAVLAHFWADEFLAWLPGRTPRSQAEVTVGRLEAACTVDLAQLTAPQATDPTASRPATTTIVGLRVEAVDAGEATDLDPDPGTDLDLDALVQAGEAAMISLKRAGSSGTLVLDPQDWSSPPRSTRQDVGQAVERALDAGELLLHYQPERDLGNGQVVAVEALLRWDHPEHGLMDAESFLPAVTDQRIMDRLTVWAWEQACRQVVDWVAPTQVWVNISARQFRIDLVERLLSITEDTGAPPAFLGLELTEESALLRSGEVAGVTASLDEHGVGISLDDFGTGYATLGSLLAIAPHSLKIDRSFVRAAATHPRSESIVRAVVGMARGVGALTVAEGVETAEDLHWVRELGVDRAQGYFTGRPAPAAQVLRLLDAPVGVEPGAA